jgi:hypothetical protein
VPRFTQDNVIDKGQDPRSGSRRPITVDGKQSATSATSCGSSSAAAAHDLVTRIVVVDDKKPDDEIRADFVDNLKRGGDYVIVNYRREEVGQRGGGPYLPARRL